MINTIYQKLAQYIYLPHLKNLEKEIGYRLVFYQIPERYIPAIMSCDITKTWKNAGLDIVKGLNHFTIGKVAGGMSSRFDRKRDEYQSWLGGYTVKLNSMQTWSVKDHMKLAIADQNSWLKRYGDPTPRTTTDGWVPIKIGTMNIGPYSGTLYEFGCTTHSDVGQGHKTLNLLYTLQSQAALYNLANPRLTLKREVFMPKPSDTPYETLDLKGYIAIFDIEPKVKTILYGNGAVVKKESGDVDTFAILKEDILNSMKSCEIIKI